MKLAITENNKISFHDREWKTFKYTDVFVIKKGKRLTKNDQKVGEYPYVSSSSLNNGVDSYVDRYTDENCLTFACYGSMGEVFYQDKKVWVSDNANVFYLKDKKLNPYIATFLVTLLKLEKFRFSYGMTGKKGRLETFSIRLPVNGQGDIDWQFMEECIKPLPNPPSSKPYVENNKISFNVAEWKNFKLGDLFLIKKCKCSDASKLLQDGDDTVYIGAKKTDNGFMRRVKNNLNLASDGNGIVFIGGGQGSVGYSLYQPRSFIGSSSLSVGYHRKLNEYNALFLVTILDLERYRYSFGREYGKDVVENAIIKLPAKSGKAGEYEPDWQFMEDYIKSLPYSSNLAGIKNNENCV